MHGLFILATKYPDISVFWVFFVLYVL